MTSINESTLDPETRLIVNSSSSTEASSFSPSSSSATAQNIFVSEATTVIVNNHEKRKPVSEPENRADESVFQKAPEKNHPPDMMKKLMDMMEVIMEKVNRLEKSVPPQQ